MRAGIVVAIVWLFAHVASAQSADAGVPVSDGGPGSDAASEPVSVSDAGSVPVPETVPVPVSVPVPETVPVPVPAPTPDTGIRGRIVDSVGGTGLEQAPVIIQSGGQTHTTLTEANGAFQLELPPGRYTIRSFFDLHHGARLEGVRVVRGRFTDVDLTLDPIIEDDVAVEEIEIPYRADTSSVAAQDQLRREATGIGEGMGSEQMSREGAS